MQTMSTATVAKRLSRLALLYEKGQASEVMDRTLDKLLTYEAEQSQAQLDELTTELSEIEHKYGMTSDEFYRRFQAGQTDDRMDFVEWASLVQMAANVRQRLSLLMGEGVQ
jgi:hypothetical protein